MAEPISVQQLKDASEDAISLAEFIYKPASAMITRRLASEIHSLQYYLEYMKSFSQRSYETYYEMVTNASNLSENVSVFVTNDLDTSKNGIYTYNGTSFVKGEYQPENAAKEFVEAKLGGLEVFDGKVRAQDVSTADGSTQNLKNTMFSLELSKQKLDTGITATAKNGGVARTQAEKNSDTLSVKDFGAVGDGITDDTNAFLNAPEGTFVPKGVYKATAVIMDKFFTADEDVRVVGGGWLDLKTNGKSGVDISLGNKIRVAQKFAYKHPNYTAATAALGSVFPQTFVIDAVKNELITISGGKHCTVFDLLTGNYVKSFKVLSDFTPETAVLRYVNGVATLYMRAADGIAVFNISNVVNLSTLTRTALLPNMKPTRSFAEYEGMWLVNDGFNRPSGLPERRGEFVLYDSNQEVKSYVNLSTTQIGSDISGDLDLEHGVAKIQGMSFDGKYIYVSVGGYYRKDRLEKPAYGGYGIKTFDMTGSLVDSSLIDPVGLTEKLSSAGYVVDRIENEGMTYVDEWGKVYSLLVGADDHSTGGAASGGILLIEHFSAHPEAWDMTHLESIENNLPAVSELQSGHLPFVLGRYFNPVKKVPFNSWADIFNYMNHVNQDYASYLTSLDPNITSVGGIPTDVGLVVKITNRMRGTFIVELEQADTGLSLSRAETFYVFGSGESWTAQRTGRVLRHLTIDSRSDNSATTDSLFHRISFTTRNNSLAHAFNFRSVLGNDEVMIGNDSGTADSIQNVTIALNPNNGVKGGEKYFEFKKDCFLPKYGAGIQSLGLASHQWGNIFSTNAAISTSDGRRKTTPEDLSDAELACAKALKPLLSKKWKWLDAVESKGFAGARWHIGVIAQDVIAVFESHNLDPFDYGIICYDAWDAEESEVEVDGEVIYQRTEAGDVYSVRHIELLSFILAAL